LQKVTVKEDTMGEWKISFNFRRVMKKKEYENLTNKFEAKTAKGFDLNIKETVVTSHEEVFKLNIDKIYAIESQIAALQQQLAHKRIINKKNHGDSFKALDLTFYSNKELKIIKKIQKQRIRLSISKMVSRCF
jgi:transposase